MTRAGVHGVRFNDGAHGWFSPAVQLEPIRAHLESQGLLKAPQPEAPDEPR